MTHEVDIDLGLGDSSVADVGQEAVAIQPTGKTDNLEVCLTDFGFSAMTADEFLQVGIDELNASMLKACKAGAAFWAAQEALKNTDCAGGAVVDFKQWFESKGLAERRVYECIRLAKFYSRLPDGRRSKLLAVGKKQALLLASLPQEVIDTAAETGSDLLDEATLMTPAELRARLHQSELAINRLQSDLNTARSRLESKALPPPLLSREADKYMQAALNAEAMGAAALDLLSRQIYGAADGDYLAERAATLHSCLSALASRVTLAFEALNAMADDCNVTLPPRPQMVVSEEMARDYLAAHSSYIETAIELAQRQLIARTEVLGRGPGRPAGSKSKRKGGA